MQIFATMSERMGPGEVGPYARRVESMGYDGLLVPEAVHDGLLTSMAAIVATESLQVVTSVLVAFPRSPMTIAHAAWDLQKISDGRFELGLGTQVRGNIVGRYSTSWSAPVSRMREYVESLKSIFHCFETGEELQFEGEHYQFTRLQPFFNPGPLEVPAPPILLGAVGPDMTRMAGGAADGLMSHPTHSSPRYLEEVTLPAIADGAARRDRNADRCPILVAGFVLTGPDESALARNRDRIREQLSFLYSTRAYWRALDHLGFGDVGRSLHELASEGRWGEMGAQVGDEMIDALVPHGCYADIAQTLLEKYASLTQRMTFPVPEDSKEDERVAEILVDLK